MNGPLKKARTSDEAKWRREVALGILMAAVLTIITLWFVP